MFSIFGTQFYNSLSYSSRELDVPEQGIVSTAPLFVHCRTLITVPECRATHSSVRVHYPVSYSRESLFPAL
jgi:hypothetical protein